MIRNYLSVIFIALLCNAVNGQSLNFPYPGNVKIGGLVNQVAETSHQGRITHFITSPQSPAIRIYNRDSVKNSKSEGWDGECAGKWLYAASKCEERTGDAQLKKNLIAVGDYIISQQDADGYMGTYNDTARFTGNPKVRKETFDLWMNGYIMQGLMELYQVTHYKRYIDATRKLADLCIRTFGPGRKNVAYSGGWNGMASGCVLEHFAQLYVVTGERKYLDFAKYCYAALNDRPDLHFAASMLGHEDVSQIGHGKMYEMLHCLVGLGKLYQVEPNDTLLKVITTAWTKIKPHLNPAGGPTGGASVFFECYDPKGLYSPYAFSETCAVMDWLRFNKELLKITGEAKYASEIERTAYNAIPGAQFNDGNGWVYHTVLNGYKNRTSPFACCSSSGTILAEEVPEAIYGLTKKGFQVNIFAASSIKSKYHHVPVTIQQVTSYPLDGKVTIKVDPAFNSRFLLSVCIPAWASDAVVTNGTKMYKVKCGQKLDLDRQWKPGSVITVQLPMHIRTERRQMVTSKNDTSAKMPYTAIYRGPLLYATHVNDNNEHPLPLVIGENELKAAAEVNIKGSNSLTLPCIILGTGKNKVQFLPYAYLNPGSKDDYRLTWFRVDNTTNR